MIGRGVRRALARVTGVEPAPQAVEAATRALRARNLAATLIEGFVEDVPLEGTFDLIMFSYCCYSYMFRLGTPG